MGRARLVGAAGAAAVVALMTFAPPAHAGRGRPSAKQEAVDRATEHFLKGEAAFREKRYDDAMTEFGAGYATLPRPGFILEMGLVQQQMGNLPRARGYYRQYLTLDPETKRRAEVEKLIADIDVTLNTSPPPAASPATPPPNLRLAGAGDDDKEVPAALKMTRSDFDEDQEEEGKAHPIYGRWWFWATVGGVVAAGAVTAILVTRAQGPGYTQSGTWGALGQ